MVLKVIYRLRPDPYYYHKVQFLKLSQNEHEYVSMTIFIASDKAIFFNKMQGYFFLISAKKCMLWILIRSPSVSASNEYPRFHGDTKKKILDALLIWS